MKFLKRVIVSVFLLTVLTSGLVFAAGSTTTNIQVQNLSSETAHCNIVYYNQDGTTALEYAFDVDPNGTWAKYQGAETGLPSGFNGSVVIACDQPVAAIVNQATSGGDDRSSSYSGEATGATGLSIPIAMKGFYGFDTEISIQNASAAAVDVTVDYYDGTGAIVPAAQDTITGLPVAAVNRLNQADNANLAANFNGSASVTATGNVVVIVNQNGPNKQNSFNAFVGGAPTVYLPSILDQFYGFVTAIQVQNVGTVATDVSIAYSDGINQGPVTVQPKQSTFFYTWTEGHAAGFNGSATVTSTGENLVAVANISDDYTGGYQSSAYNGFGGGSTQFVLPSVLQGFYGYNSSIQIQNVSAASVDCTVTYDDGVTPVVGVGTLTGMAPGASALVVNGNEAHGGNYQGSATVVCTGDVVAIVTQGPIAATSYDGSVAYNGMTP